MHFGIPKYRLPREVLDAEVARIAAMGVQIELNHKVTDLVAEKTGGRFDAVFLAVGAHLSKRQEIPARDAGQIYDALDFLRDVERGSEPPRLGRRVAIYGGGNTAMDAARTARRLGTEPLIIYRRTRSEMPAHAFEADEAIEEGVKIHWLRTIKEIDGATLRVEVMRLDEHRSPQPTGEFETLQADSLILALGQDTDTAFLRNVPGLAFKSDGTVVIGPDMQTGCTGVFAGGDMVPYTRTVTTAIGHGKRAARRIDAFLRGAAWTSPGRHESRPSTCSASGITPRQRDVARARSTSRIVNGRSMKWSAVSMRTGHDTSRSAASRAATASSAMGVTRRARNKPCESWALAFATSTTWTSAPDARSATTSALAAQSPWCRSQRRRRHRKDP